MPSNSDLKKKLIQDHAPFTEFLDKYVKGTIDHMIKKEYYFGSTYAIEYDKFIKKFFKNFKTRFSLSTLICWEDRDRDTGRICRATKLPSPVSIVRKKYYGLHLSAYVRRGRAYIRFDIKDYLRLKEFDEIFPEEILHRVGEMLC